MSQSHFVQANGIELHYLEHAGTGPLMILLPGLTANAQSFSGLIAAGLAPQFRVLTVDLRGRGLSQKPTTGYSIRHHAEDIVGLLDGLGVEKAIIGGHSYGAFVSMYLGAYYGDRVEKLVLLDAAARLNPRTRELIQPSIDRLSRVLPSTEDYIAMVKELPQWQGFWDIHVEAYYRAELFTNPNGTVQPITSAAAIIESTDLNMQEPWSEHIKLIRAPSILINAPGPYGPHGTPPVISPDQAQETTQLMRQCRYVRVPGNHSTMLFGENVPHVVRAITNFCNPPSST